jgi:glycosyltransferase involved in cell wall biosynthesis
MVLADTPCFDSSPQLSMQTVLAHPAPTPFVQQVGRALYEANMLQWFATTLIDNSNSSLFKSLSQIIKAVKPDLDKQLSRRAVTEFPRSKVIDYPWGELSRILVSKVDKDKRTTDIVFHWATHSFDQWVAQKGLSHAQAVYGYEYCCLETFKAAEVKGIARVYDVPSPEHDFVEDLLEEEFSQFPELQTPYRRYCRARQAERTEHRRQEWQRADLVIANSAFTKASYVKAGVPEEKVRVVPYGAPPIIQAVGEEKVCQSSTPISFLWAGTFSVRKGAHYLLRAWKKLNPGQSAKLQVLGAMGLPESLLCEVPDSVSLSGTVPRSELYPLYQQADALVFPTLCDGFGMVVTEAFANGLPVITTDRAGASDLVKHGINGLIVPAGDVDALTEAMHWCMAHPEELRAMRQSALETAAGWQWSDYRRTLLLNLEEGLQQAGYLL